jgi:hypothetical protein
MLTPGIARDQPQLPIAGQLIRETREQPLTLGVAQNLRRANVPDELYARGGLVDVLSAGARRPAGTDDDF